MVVGGTCCSILGNPDGPRSRCEWCNRGGGGSGGVAVLSALATVVPSALYVPPFKGNIVTGDICAVRMEPVRLAPRHGVADLGSWLPRRPPPSSWPRSFNGVAYVANPWRRVACFPVRQPAKARPTMAR